MAEKLVAEQKAAAAKRAAEEKAAAQKNASGACSCDDTASICRATLSSSVGLCSARVPNGWRHAHGARNVWLRIMA